MREKLLLFAHVLVGTFAIFAAQYAESIAEGGKFKDAFQVIPHVVQLLTIFLLLLVFQVFFEKLAVNERKKEELKRSGLIEGSWLEKSSENINDKLEFDLGAFITIIYSPKERLYQVLGEVFSADGKEYGNFSGDGRIVGKKLMYNYEGRHGSMPDAGTGSFSFGDKNGRNQAINFTGTFHGASTGMVRNVVGIRADDLDKNLSGNELKRQQREKVCAFLQGKNVW